MSLALGADLVQSIGTADDHAGDQSHQLQTLNHQDAQASRVHADNNSPWLCRVAQGSHEVEDRGNAQLSPRLAGVLHGGVISLRKKEAESVIVQQCSHLLGLNIIDSTTNLFQNISRSTGGGSSSVSVL